MSDSGEGTLFIVATPIGNLEDMTFRAVRVLREVDVILCEDTRVTGGLLDHFEIDGKLKRHDAHTEAASSAGAIALLGRGLDVALVSDAGTPGISDPGQRLVRVATGAGYQVRVVPGASAVAAAMSGAGIGEAGFSFGGFLPKKSGQLAKRLGALGPGVHSFFIPARDLERVVQGAATYPQITGCVVARELTKAHESWYRGTPSEVSQSLSESPHSHRGEAVIIFECETVEVDDAALSAALRAAIEAGATPRDAVRQVADAYGANRKRIYGLSLKL